jgi:5-methylthioribose kinase
VKVVLLKKCIQIFHNGIILGAAVAASTTAIESTSRRAKKEANLQNKSTSQLSMKLHKLHSIVNATSTLEEPTY